MYFIRAPRPLVHLALWLAAAAASPSLYAQVSQVPHVAPVGPMWSAGKGFDFGSKEKKTRRAVSGIACAADVQGRNVCLLAVDEGVAMPFAILNPAPVGQLRVLEQTMVLGRRGTELDAEAAATDGAYFYLTGSHAAKRGDCAPNPASRHVFRFKRDPKTGLPAQDLALQDSGRLADLIAALPELRPLLAQDGCLGRGGLDIEALAVRRGRLWFGLRGPTEAAAAFIVSVDAQALFSGADADAQVQRLALGAGRGLRDMVAVADGILLLAGPDDAKRNADVPWQLLHWEDTKESAAASTPKPLAELDLSGVKLRQCDKEIKPEAVTVLDETRTHYRVLVLSDGLCDGGAMVFEVAR